MKQEDPMATPIADSMRDLAEGIYERSEFIRHRRVSLEALRKHGRRLMESEKEYLAAVSAFTQEICK